MSASHLHWLLWDGECGFCAWAVAQVRRRDQQGRFRDVPSQSAPADLLTPEVRQACQGAVAVLTHEGKLLRAGRAVLFIGTELGYGWLTRPLSLPPFVWLVEVGYWLVARMRRLLSRWLKLCERGCAR